MLSISFTPRLIAESKVGVILRGEQIELAKEIDLRMIH